MSANGVPGRPRVLFLPGWWYPTPADPVQGIFIRKHAEAVRRFCDVAVLFVNGSADAPATPVVEAADEDGIPTVRVDYRRPCGGSMLARVRDAVRYGRALDLGSAELRAIWGRPQLNHVHVNPPAGLVLALNGRWRSLPYLFTEHWTGYFPEDGRFRGAARVRLTRRLVRRAAVVTVVSRAAQRVMEDAGLSGTYELVPNVVDTELFRPPEEDAGRSAGPFTLVHVSNLDPVHKNPAGLLRAVAALAAAGIPVRLLVVGDGPGRAPAEAVAAELGLTGRVVEFVGRRPVAAVAAILRSADALVMFSNFENSPCVISEAQACGLPVVSTDVGGIAELVDDATGILVRAGDEAELTRALARLESSRDSWDRGAIRRIAVARCSYDVVGRRFCDLYLRERDGRLDAGELSEQ